MSLTVNKFIHFVMIYTILTHCISRFYAYNEQTKTKKKYIYKCVIHYYLLKYIPYILYTALYCTVDAMDHS